MHLLPTNEGDAAQLFVEPFVRVDLGPLMLSTRLMMNLDEPLGFAFDSGKYWGLHVGAGLAF